MKAELNGQAGKQAGGAGNPSLLDVVNAQDLQPFAGWPEAFRELFDNCRRVEDEVLNGNREPVPA